MASFDKSIDVDVPVAEAYLLFSEFERFPSFMEGVESVERIGQDELRWRANIAGREEEWTARITEQAPSQRIAWESTSGARNAGEATFDKLDANHTRVHLHIEYEPEGFVENVGALLGIVNGRMSADLERFKQLVEEGGAARSGWHASDGSRAEATAAEMAGAEPRRDWHDPRRSLDEVTASDLMDGGQRRDARMREDRHATDEPGAWHVGDPDPERTRYGQGLEDDLIGDIDDPMRHGAPGSAERMDAGLSDERERHEAGPDVHGSEDRLYSDTNLLEAEAEGLADDVERGAERLGDELDASVERLDDELGRRRNARPSDLEGGDLRGGRRR
ncbi:MAG: SRPBCC family protein [Deinococcales bacterium]|nr:SRPBCC family protein [Deinococcales bacterium]